MEAGGGVGRRRMSRETSPDRARVAYSQRPRPTAPGICRTVQIIYYLSRNGQLEHPHFMELPQLPNQHLRLKDVMERLTVLRGRGMPSLYSWSCKRSYKNGYVWNDLSENDVIYPAYGAEYVLKGSEIIRDSSERFQQLQVSERRRRSLPLTHSSRLQLEAEVPAEEEEEEEEMEEEEEKGGNLTTSAKNNSSCCNTPYSRRSRGVSTDEIEQIEKPGKTQHRNHHPTEIPLDDASPPSSSSSEKAAAATGAPSSRRFDDGESENETALTRNSVLLQLISCGSMATKGRSGVMTKGAAASSSAASSPSGGLAGGSSGRKSGSLHKGVLSRLATRAAAEEEDELSRQLEEKEYFSGSIVETITESSRAPPEPSLKKSSSYNEERSSKLGIGEVAEERSGVKGKCIPGRKRGSCKATAAAGQHVTIVNK